jgi:hypothetical protein
MIVDESQESPNKNYKLRFEELDEFTIERAKAGLITIIDFSTMKEVEFNGENREFGRDLSRRVD